VTPCRIPVLLIATALLAGCAGQDPAATDDVFDPYEETNRDIHDFNKGLDRALVGPVASGYSTAVPDHLETRVVRLAENLSLPGDVVNNMLQLNMRGAFRDTARFLVNSTLGLGGLFDPASEMGMAAPTNTDFGATLKAMDVGEGPYVALPVLGPSTSRAAVGIVGDFLISPLRIFVGSPENYIVTGAGIASGLSRRDQLSDTIEQILYESEDSYALSRSIYLQNRRFELGGTESDAYTDPYDRLRDGDAATGAAQEATVPESPYE